jgi:asparagine synthase (glutamine-hydrolysing)
VCGIAGEVRVGGGDVELVRAMCATLEHRGPDELGLGAVGDAVLGMRRLAIIGLKDGQQPMLNEDGSVHLVFNGEIYNFRELRVGLEARGHTFRSSSDTEVIVHLYEEHAERCVNHLRGMFAFALWDQRRQRLILARDRVGKKPLYYAEQPGRIVFGSELRSLMADPAIARTVDPVALHHYLTYASVPAPWSIFDGVHKLPPASVLVRDASGTKVTRYWSLDYTRKTGLDEHSAVERLRELIRESTAIRMVSERPLGAFLSGGIDSSVVVAAMAETSGQPVRTFSIGFDDPRYDERRYARLVAEWFGTKHEELVVRPDPVSLLGELAERYDEPFADSSAIPTLELSRMTSQHVVVALNGDGGDESFGGYTRYAAMALSERLQSLAVFRPVVDAALRRLPPGDGKTLVNRLRKAALLLGGDASERYAKLMTYSDSGRKASLYTDEMSRLTVGHDSAALVIDLVRGSTGQSLIDRMLDADVRSYLPNDLLVKVDIATMAHSLEGRSPLLDHHLMEFAASLPPRWKVHGRETKYLLKLAARGWLPDEVLDRPKMGFGVPVARWLREELRTPIRDLLTDGTAKGRGWFETDKIETLLTAHEAGIDNSLQLWPLLQLENWARRWLD